MTKAKILYVDHHFQMGGAERSLLCLLKYVDRTRFEPILASTDASPLAAEARKLGVRVETTSMGRLRNLRDPAATVLRLRKGVSELRAIIARENIPIVHSNVMRASIYAAVAAKLGRAKLIWHVRDIHREQLYMNVMARTADSIITISNAVAASLPAVTHSRTTIIHNGVDLDEFDPGKATSNLRETLRIPRDAIVFGSIAWIAPWKRQHIFLEAAAKIVARQPNAVFVLIGGLADQKHTDYYEALQNLAQRELKGKAIFAGPIGSAVEALADIDVLVHTADTEPFGRVLVEAMALEKPVIAPQSGGPLEIVEQGKTGILVPDGDVGALAEAMQLLGSDREKAREMGLRGRQRVETRFNAEEQARKVERVYDEILGNR